jgi:hypothetical protein
MNYLELQRHKKGVASFLKKLILDHNFHFICLQENMQVELDDQIPRKFDINQSYLWKWIPSKGRSGGIVVGINVRFMDVGPFCEGEYMLQMNLWDKEKRERWNLINIYGVVQDEKRENFLFELASSAAKIKNPTYYVGTSILSSFLQRK